MKILEGRICRCFKSIFKKEHVRSLVINKHRATVTVSCYQKTAERWLEENWKRIFQQPQILGFWGLFWWLTIGQENKSHEANGKLNKCLKLADALEVK